MLSLRQRCLHIIAQVDTDHGWNLGPGEQAQYVAGLLPHLPADDPASPAFARQVRQQVELYHQEHPQVAALRDPQHPQHIGCQGTFCHQGQSSDFYLSLMR